MAAEAKEAKEPPTTLEDSEESDSSEENSSASEMDFLRDLFSRTLGLGTPEKVLDELSLEGVGRFLLSGKCKNVVFMVGAGISTSAGIPDFRSPGSGLYSNLQKYNLPYPEAIFEIGFFKQNPEPFFALARELYPGQFKARPRLLDCRVVVTMETNRLKCDGKMNPASKGGNMDNHNTLPTVCHYFMRLMKEKGMLLRCYTQNIDTLERVAGLSSDDLVEAHGTFHTSHCVGTFCGAEYPLPWMKEKIFSDLIPKCDKCNSLVKPDIVFFGESLPPRFFSALKSDFRNVDLLIVMGTSLQVQPFASLVGKVPSKTPRLLINKEKTGEGDSFFGLLGLGGGMDFDSEKAYRDVAWLGHCDDGCLALADFLGWKAELEEMMKKEHAAIDAATEKSSPKKTEEKKSPEKKQGEKSTE